MVHDPRVTSCLARLGGVYRDPARVDRDAASLLKSSVGANLVPIVALMHENNGSQSNVLVLQGTIAIHFKGNTYQILMDLYLPAGYVSVNNRHDIIINKILPHASGFRVSHGLYISFSLTLFFFSAHPPTHSLCKISPQHVFEGKSQTRGQRWKSLFALLARMAIAHAQSRGIGSRHVQRLFRRTARLYETTWYFQNQRVLFGPFQCHFQYFE